MATVLSLVDAAWFAFLALFVLDVFNMGAGAFGALLSWPPAHWAGWLAPPQPTVSRLVGSLLEPSSLASLVATAVAQVVLGLANSVLVVGAMLAVSSGAFAVYKVTAVTVRQRVTPRDAWACDHDLQDRRLGRSGVRSRSRWVIAEVAGLRAPMLVLAPSLLSRRLELHPQP